MIMNASTRHSLRLSVPVARVLQGAPRRPCSIRGAPRRDRIVSGPAKQCRSTHTASLSASRGGKGSVFGISGAAAALALWWYWYFTPITRLDAAQSKGIALPDIGALSSTPAAVRLDPATQQPFPTTLPAPKTATGSKQLSLVGLGVRTVSFLRVRVYVAGLYVDAQALEKLAATPGWRGFEAAWMMAGSDKGATHPSSEVLLNALLDQGIACAIRIIPVRSTDYSHLRDGFTRSIQSRAKLARKAGQLNAETDEALSQSLQSLKEAFPKASLAKGSSLDLIFTPASTPHGLDLTLEEGGRVLGTIKSLAGGVEAGRFSVARQLLLAYFADKDEISKPFKESVAQGFEEIIRR